jgi:hypothetical protein
MTPPPTTLVSVPALQSEGTSGCVGGVGGGGGGGGGVVRFIEPDDLDFLMSPGGLTFGETRRKTRKTEEEANNLKGKKN